MDIASLSIAQSTINVASDVQVAVLSKSLDTMETLGDGMKKMMESSVTPYLGQNISFQLALLRIFCHFLCILSL